MKLTTDRFFWRHKRPGLACGCLSPAFTKALRFRDWQAICHNDGESKSGKSSPNLELRSLGMIGFDPRPARIFGRNRQERHHPPMRFVARLCMFFVFFLAIELACSGIPGLLSFGDDTSNDFAFWSCAPDLRTDRAVHERSNCLASNPITKALFSTDWRRCLAFSPASSAGAELLLFLSIQRK